MSARILASSILFLTLFSSYSITEQIPESPAGGGYLDLRGKKQGFYYTEDINNCFDGKFFENGFTIELLFCPARVTKPGEWWVLVSKPASILPWYEAIYELRVEHQLIIRDDRTEWMVLKGLKGLWDLTIKEEYKPTWHNVILQGYGAKRIFCDVNNICVDGFYGIAFVDGVSSGAFGHGGSVFILDSDLPLYVGGLPTEAKTILYFGRNEEPFNITPFDGLIDELRISNIMRYDWKNPGEKIDIQKHLLADKHTVALWHFDEGPGSHRYEDASGNGHTLLADKQLYVSQTYKFSTYWGAIKKGNYK